MHACKHLSCTDDSGFCISVYTKTTQVYSYACSRMSCEKAVRNPCMHHLTYSVTLKFFIKLNPDLNTNLRFTLGSMHPYMKSATFILIQLRIIKIVGS